MMMIQMNKAVVPGQVCLTRARIVPNPNQPAGRGCLRNLVHVAGKGKGKGKLLVAALTPTPTPIQSIQRRRRSCPLMATSHPNAEIIAINKSCPLIDHKINICPLIPSSSSSSSSSGDPCLDLFSNSLRAFTAVTNPCLKYLEQVLPLAWSHDPLTTLKLIFNEECKFFSYRKFDTAIYWLHQNHPKTLLRNLHSIANLPKVRRLDILVQILHVIVVENRGGRLYDNSVTSLHLHPERYDRDPDYRLLHDRAVDIFVEHFRSEMDKVKQQKLKLMPSDYFTDGDNEEEEEEEEEEDDDDDYYDDDDDGENYYPNLFVSAAVCCTNNDENFDDLTEVIFLRESIARRLCPPESDQSEEWERLKKQFLVPLTNYYVRRSRRRCSRRRLSGVEGPSLVKKYLEEVKVAAGGGIGTIKPNALLPNEIIRYVQDKDVGEVAKLHWKAMVENIKQQQIQEGDGLGKFKNWLVVGQLPGCFAIGLEILVSEVSEEPWKGKMIKYTSDGKCQLDLIQGHDLESKFKFTSRYLKSDEGCYRHIINAASNTRQLEKLFDLIVEIGVNENLKAEQMIKKVIVFTGLPPLFSRSFEYEYELLRSLFEAIQSKYEDKGYGDDAVPHILFLHSGEHSWICRRHPGFTLLSGFSTHLYKSFMDNGGELDLHHLMEAVISDKEYQTLTVVD